MWSDAPDAGALSCCRQAIGDRRLPAPAPIGRRPLAGAAAPERWVELLRGGAEHMVWLDGGRQERHLIAWDPLMAVSCRDGRARFSGAGAGAEVEAGGFVALAALEAELRGRPFRLFGFLGHELAAELEQLPAPPPADMAVPDLWLGLHDAWIEVSGDEGVLVTCSERWNHTRREALATALEQVGGRRPTERRATGGLPPGARVAAGAGIRVRPDDHEYEQAVARVVEAIHRGDLFQTNLCRRFEAVDRRDGAVLYRRMRQAGDSAYGAWLTSPDWQLLSRSPECFLRVRNRKVESRPIKGTRPRGSTPEEDRLLRDALVGSRKDQAELAMIVDLVRNDLGRVCEAGSVRVADHGGLMELSGVWHTCTRVIGQLAEDVGPTRLLRAAFPPGSVTGAPKIQALVVANGEEPTRRGPAMGAIGWIDPAGDLELSVAIRTAVADADRVVYHAGCGIVADSDPREEREESLVKARPFLSAFSS